jgi:glutamate synthase domain-containing protein 3
MPRRAKEDERKFILECIQVYHSLPALWNVKSKDYTNRKKKKEYEQLLRKYREKFPDADKEELIQKFNSLRTNFRKELKRIKDGEKTGTGADDVVEPALWYFEEMKFLIGQEEACKSLNTIQMVKKNRNLRW